jgi:hypothetical protein
MSNSATAHKIAAKLNETETRVLATIQRLVDTLGEERALALLDEALRIEANGGMFTEDFSRRRTGGGIFFKLAKNRSTAKERQAIFGPDWSVNAARAQQISWGECTELAIQLLNAPTGDRGDVTVKITIVGRPGRITKVNNVVMTIVENVQRPANLPKGLPRPPRAKTPYLIYIAAKQWRRVKDSIYRNKGDKLVIEGYPYFDKRIGERGTMVVLAQSVTTIQIQRARREAQRAAGSK